MNRLERHPAGSAPARSQQWPVQFGPPVTKYAPAFTATPQPLQIEARQHHGLVLAIGLGEDGTCAIGDERGSIEADLQLLGSTACALRRCSPR